MSDETMYYPEVVDAPCATYVMIRGRGPWDTSNSKFSEASKIIRNVHKELSASEGFDVSLKRTPLEAFWWQHGALELDLDDKESFIWAVAMQVGNVSNESFQNACKALAKSKGYDCGNVFLSTVMEGHCAQLRHTGGYEHEKVTVARLREFVDQEGYKVNPYGFSPLHEIYIPLKEAGKWGQWDTIYRWPIARKHAETVS